MHTSREWTGRPRVVMTGMGVISPIGDNVSAMWNALITGTSGITRWKNRGERIYSQIGGDMSDFDVEDHLQRIGSAYPSQLLTRTRKLMRVTPLCGQLTTVSALQAWHDAGWGDSTAAFSERMGHVLAGHNLNGIYIYDNTLTLQDEPDYIDPLYGLLHWDTDVLSVISEILSIKGPTFSVGNACASSSAALLAALDLLYTGRAETVLVTASAINLDPTILHGLAVIGAISHQSFNDEPERASRPFDKRREGFVPSEGAAAIMLETLEGARSRDARIHAEILGVASTSDANRGAGAHQDGEVRVMQGALRDARLNTTDVDYINAHAASTPLGDAVEVAAIKQVFGTHAYKLAINSTKSMTGHCTMAAGLVELIATVLQMKNGILHPTINQEEPDPTLDLDFVPNKARPGRINVALSNSFGLGGLNASVVVGRAPA